MSKLCCVDVDGESFVAHQGDMLLDAALMNGIELPHDCRSGYCGTCRVRVLSGHTFGGASQDAGFIRACQARVISDLRIEVEEAPTTVEVEGRLVDLRKMAPDVFELGVEPAAPLVFIPGQYLSLRFRGFPARHYSPTAPLEPAATRDLLRFHVRQFRQGQVSSALGRGIAKGHRVRLSGPFGSAHFRKRNASRLVLVASGTGFAPIWAIADAAMREWPERELVLIAAARSLHSLYMLPALCQLAQGPRVTITLVSSTQQSFTRAVRFGRPTDHLPVLRPDDLVYAAGAPAMVEAVSAIAHAAGATCHADPFAPADPGGEGSGLLVRASGWFARRGAAAMRLEAVGSA
jgi:3-phenylpropionate/trans-cinnamate dioxygenase ferredoxin reductase subunit